MIGIKPRGPDQAARGIKKGEVNIAKIRLRMGNAAEIRKTLNRVSNMVANCEMDPRRANAIVLACNAVLSSIKTIDQAKKIEELEKLLEDITNYEKDR